MVFPWLIRIVAMLRVRSSDLCNHVSQALRLGCLSIAQCGPHVGPGHIQNSSMSSVFCALTCSIQSLTPDLMKCPPGRSGNRGASCLISTPSIVRRTNKVDKKPRGRDGVDGIDISVVCYLIEVARSTTSYYASSVFIRFLSVHTAYSHGLHRETKMNML